MNLVQINEHLKGVPMQALMSYANGQDPTVPAYMATGEMKRREVMSQKNAQSQQAAQGQSPTVKDQVEQQAGLMVLQAQQQKQAQQQMMQQAQAQPMPAPPNTPQPEMQGQEQPEFAMGGIAQLPVDYDFASGGIIAFAGEGRSDVPAAEETDEEKLRRVKALLSGQMPSSQSRPPPPSPERNTEERGLPSLMGPPTPAKDTRPGADIPGMYDTTASDLVKQRMTPRELKDVFAQQAEADKLAGVEGKFGEAQMKRYGEEDAQYKAMLKDREFNRMLAVLSGMGRGGLGGAAPAYLQAQASEQAADIAQKRRMNELYGNVEAKQREEAMGKSKGALGTYEAERNQAGELAGKVATTQMAGQADFAKEAMNNKNQLDRLEIERKSRLEEAKTRYANDQELRKIENDYAVKRDKVNRDAQVSLEKFRQTAPPDEQRNLDAYLVRWKKNPANKDKQETEGVTQYFSDRSGGQYKEDSLGLRGLHDLQTIYNKQLENLMLPKEKRAALEEKLDGVNKQIEDRVNASSPNPAPGKKGAPSVSNW
jgi:hypothetical protein